MYKISINTDPASDRCNETNLKKFWKGKHCQQSMFAEALLVLHNLCCGCVYKAAQAQTNINDSFKTWKTCFLTELPASFS